MPVDPADQTLPEDMKPIPSVDLYVETALAGRPEFAQLREGIEARRRLVEVERKQGYPLFFVGLLGDLAYATNRDRLENPYVIDPLYHTAVGPVIGFKYSLDFGIRAGKVKEAQAEVQKLEALREHALDGIPLQVRDAYDTVVEAERNAKVLAEAFDNAKQWLVASSSNVDLGVGDPDDLADAFVQYARTRADYLQARLRLRLRSRAARPRGGPGLARGSAAVAAQAVRDCIRRILAHATARGSRSSPSPWRWSPGVRPTPARRPTSSRKASTGCWPSFRTPP